ncbi:MAG TPA: hypothetical protein DD670_13515 [Planctomycetaceae bacterium]|nr:hypothetical protein [Planctomycetaceae bacterium]
MPHDGFFETIELGRILDDLKAVVERAEAGDHSVVPRIRELLELAPQIWKNNSDAARHVGDAWIKLLAADNLLLRESLRNAVDAMYAEFGGDDPTPLERLLIDRLVVSWLQMSFLDARLSQHHRTTDSPDTTVWQKRHDAAYRRHLEAIRVLAEVRRLLPR